MRHSQPSRASDRARQASPQRRASFAMLGRRFTRVAFLATVALTLAACARTARLDSTWRDPGFQDSSLNRLLVVAAGRTPLERRLFEDQFVAALRARGVEAQASYALIGDAKVDSALVEAQMHRAGCDGILVSRVVDRQTVRRYYGGGYAPAYNQGRLGYFGPPSGYHGGWWPYYSLGYGYATSGAFAADDQRVSVETNLYRHDNGQLVWSGLSRQWLTSASAPGSETGDVVRALVAELTRVNVVKAGAASPAASVNRTHARARVAPEGTDSLSR
jgi:hypothetical protein